MNNVFDLPPARYWLKKISISIVYFSILAASQISTADSTTDAESIFDNFLLPMQLSVLNEMNKVLDNKPELKEGIDFINAVDFPTMFANNRAGMVAIIKSNLSKKELTYLKNYVTQPEVKKHFSLATQHRSFEKAFALLSDEEKAVVNNKNPEMEASITPKLQKMNTEIKSLVAYSSIDVLEAHREILEKKHSLDEICQTAYDKAIYNSSFLACGLGHKHNHKISSKIFAKIMWRGDFLEKDIPKALAIYKQLLSQDTDPEVAFYYGVLNFNMTTDKETKRKAACWIKLSSSKIYNNAVGFYNDIKDDYPDLPNHCQFIANN